MPDWNNAVVVSPDEGGTKKAVSVANDLFLDFALIHNRYRPNRMQEEELLEEANKKMEKVNLNSRTEDAGADDDGGQAELTPRSARKRRRSAGHHHLSDRRYGCLSGSIRNRTAIVIDDMIDTGTTLDFAAEVLDREGAKDVYFLATHGVFAASAPQVIADYDDDFLKAIVVSNSISQERNKNIIGDRLHVIDVSGLIAEFIRRHHYRESVSVLSQFMPIRDVDSFHHRRIPHDQLRMSISSNVEDEIGAKVAAPDSNSVVEGNCLGDENKEDANSEVLSQNQDKRMQSLRKGFRLSSMCWDD